MKTTTRIHASPVSDKNGQRPDTPAGFPARLASRWLDGLIAERGLSRNTVAAYRQDLDALRDFLDELETPLSGLDDENITLFIAWLRKRGDATRTLARRISSLRSFLAWCVERGELASNPAALIDTPKLPSLLPDVLTQDEIVRLLNAPDATSKLVTNMAFGAYNKAFGDKPRTPNDWLSADTDNVDRYMADPMCGAEATVGLFRQMLRGLRFNQTPRNIDKMDKDAPILLIAGQSDPVGDMGAGVRRTHDAFKRAGIKDVTLKLYPGLRHEILNEAAMQDTVHGDIRAWMARVLG